MSIYAVSLLVSFGLFTVIFAVAYRQKNYHFINAFWPLGFVAIALVGIILRVGERIQSPGWYSPSACGPQVLRYIDVCTSRLPTALSPDPKTFWPALLVSGLVTAWALRLTWHILKRNRRHSGRLKLHITPERARSRAKLFLQLALSEAGLLWLVSLPLQFLYTIEFNDDSYSDGLLYGPFVIGVIVWLAGFAYETIADAQLHRFTTDPANAGKVLQTGLWRYSRHPNYFGEALMWWGIFITTLVAYEPRFWLILSPLIVTYMLRYVSGVPVLEKRYEDSGAYASYRRRTNAMVPWPPRRKQ